MFPIILDHYNFWNQANLPGPLGIHAFKHSGALRIFQEAVGLLVLNTFILATMGVCPTSTGQRKGWTTPDEWGGGMGIKSWTAIRE